MNKTVLFLQIILQFLEVRLLNQECMSMPIRQRLPRTHLQQFIIHYKERDNTPWTTVEHLSRSIRTHERIWGSDFGEILRNKTPLDGLLSGSRVTVWFCILILLRKREDQIKIKVMVGKETAVIYVNQNRWMLGHFCAWTMSSFCALDNIIKSELILFLS